MKGTMFSRLIHSYSSLAFRIPTVRFYSVIPTEKKKCYYASLDLKPGASAKRVKESYYSLSKKYHPDMNAGSVDATAKIQEINEAFEILGNAIKKAEYDSQIKVTTARTKGESFIYDVQEPRYYYYKAPQSGMKVNHNETCSSNIRKSHGGRSPEGNKKRKQKYDRMNIFCRKTMFVSKFSRIA